MFTGLGIPEIILILAVLLLLFGARRLPQIARGLGSGIRNFKRSMAGDGDEALPREEDGEEADTPSEGARGSSTGE